MKFILHGIDGKMNSNSWEFDSFEKCLAFAKTFTTLWLEIVEYPSGKIIWSNYG